MAHEGTDEAIASGGVSRRNFIKGVIAAGASVSASAYLFRTTILGQNESSLPGSVERLITLDVNGQQRRVDVMKQETLAQTLRYKLGLTGTKIGCDRSECGACTVLVDGVAVDSCLVPVVHVDGTTITTIEGVSGTREGRALQDAFVELGGAQCGICTPGMIVASLPIGTNPSLTDVQTALAGNLCRCTGYLSIFRSVKRAKRNAVTRKKQAPRRRTRARTP